MRRSLYDHWHSMTHSLLKRLFTTGNLRVLLLVALGMGLSSCATMENYKKQQALTLEQKAAAAKHAEFRTTKNWRSKVYKDAAILAQATPEDTSIIISIKDQRGLLFVHKMVAMDFPIASGRKDHPTPLGEFKIRDKQKTYGSNVYGKIYDATGVVTNSSANAKTDVIPEGGKFEGASMPYWMRLTDDGVGLHTGYVPGHPASHGCVRMPDRITPVVYVHVKIGTPVEIVELYDPAAPKKKK
ncbi:MAG: L,D-transpeptidase [Chthoniobacterales bacterium]